VNDLKAWWDGLSKNERIAVVVSGVIVIIVGYVVARRARATATTSPKVPVKAGTSPAVLPPRSAAPAGAGYGYSPSSGGVTSNDNAVVIARINAQVAEDRIKSQERLGVLQAQNAQEARQQAAAQSAIQKALGGGSPGGGNQLPPGGKKTPPEDTPPARMSTTPGVEGYLSGSDETNPGPGSTFLQLLTPGVGLDYVGGEPYVPAGSVETSTSFSPFVNPQATGPQGGAFMTDFTLYDVRDEDPGYYVRMTESGGFNNVDVAGDAYSFGSDVAAVEPVYGEEA